MEAVSGAEEGAGVEEAALVEDELGDGVFEAAEGGEHVAFSVGPSSRKPRKGVQRAERHEARRSSEELAEQGVVVEVSAEERQAVHVGRKTGFVLEAKDDGQEDRSPQPDGVVHRRKVLGLPQRRRPGGRRSVERSQREETAREPQRVHLLLGQSAHFVVRRPRRQSPTARVPQPARAQHVPHHELGPHRLLTFFFFFWLQLHRRR
mmetsp:Transcript_12366/g.37334  ORF Transcript_12366/g.37334 Transcript_12366/m.37334 type:complete len:206 (-) Transcript_12366:15-632(-)